MQENQELPKAETGAQKTKKEEKNERKRLWKEAKKNRREEQKEYYKYAPKLVRAWNLYLKIPVVVVLICAILVGLLKDYIASAAQMVSYFAAGLSMSRELTADQREEIYELSPIDYDGEEKINRLPAAKSGDTWTVCVYFVGADLEDDEKNDLSYVVSMLREEQQAENQSALQSRQLENLQRFSGELEENGLELPQFFFYPDIQSEASEESGTDVLAALGVERDGAASTDIGEILSDVWSDKINVVIQTGGATHWTNRQVNPNRTQRFLVSKGEFTEIENLALQPASDPETLADFMRYCAKNYPADHTMLVLWDHGAGAFGYGVDSIYEHTMSLKEIRSALQSAFGNVKEPPYDIIGFDACLMSSLEVTEALYGYADYYAVSEEVEPGDGWAYDGFLSAMTEDSTLSPANVARTIADTYTDHYIENNIKNFLHNDDVTFSVIDANAAHELYQAYTELCRAQLTDAVEDLSVLSKIGICAKESTRFGGAQYKVYNEVDLGNYADLMTEYYPKECGQIQKLLDETVLYHRQNGALTEATGMAVYIPAEVSDISGLIYFLDYIYDISENDDITALYYYKQAGCLNEELEDYVKELTGKEPAVLDVTPLKNFAKIEPVIESDHFSIPLNDGMEDLIADYVLEVGCYNEDEDSITYYGRDRLVDLDEDQNLISDFDGKWIFLDDTPLALEVTSSTPSATEYRSLVEYKNEEAYLMLSLDKKTGKVSITGVKEISEEGNLSYFVNARSGQMPEEGSSITPIYEESDLSNDSTLLIHGDAVTFDQDTKVEMKALPKGYYLCTAVLSDSRGDVYYSAVVGADVSGSGVSSWQRDDRFYGAEDVQ